MKQLMSENSVHCVTLDSSGIKDKTHSVQIKHSFISSRLIISVSVY